MWELLKSRLRHCAFCSRFGELVDLYCSDCWWRLEHLQPRNAPIYGPYPIHALWLWNETDHARISNLVYALKEGGLPGAWKRLAELSILNSVPRVGDKSLIVVPAPPKKGGAHDHAFEFARALSEVLAAELGMWLKDPDQRDQRQLSRQDRKLRRFEAAPDTDPKSQRVIFVDDIYTTGATAAAAFKALNKPKHFEVYVLARRIALPPL